MRKEGRVVLVAPIAGTAVVSFLVQTLLPVPHRFSMQGAGIYDAEPICKGIDTTAGGTVTFRWSAPSSVYFAAVSCSFNQVVYDANGTHGSGTFVSRGGTYEFGAMCPAMLSPAKPCEGANVSGSYMGPLLAV
jgi:hypothetical protein